MLTATALSKQFTSRKVISGLSFAWHDPGVYLVAGVNGSGKSTLLSMLGGALTPDAGEIVLGGFSLKTQQKQALRRLSYCPADCPIFPFLRGCEWLNFVASTRGDWDKDTADHLQTAFGLDTYLDCRFDQMSLGTARKFMLIGAIATKAEVLILDEPCNALDNDSLQVLEHVLQKCAKTRLIVTACHQASPHEVFGVSPAAVLILQGI